MTFHKTAPFKVTLLSIGLGMIAALVACSSSSTPPPPTIAITAGTGTTPQSTQVGTAFTTALSVTVTSNGAPSSGVSVTFTAPASGASGVFTTSGTATETDPTNSSGVATASAFTANTDAGAYTVTASTSGTTATASFSLTNTAGTAASLAATGGTPQTVAVGATSAPLVAQVTDADGNPVQGVSVTFTAPASGASGSFTSTTSNTEPDVTDVNGNATAADFVANSTQGGPYNVVASSTGLTSVNFVLTNGPPVVATLGSGNYVFYLAGVDTDDFSLSFVSGVFTVSAGVITGGEQDYVDADNYGTQDAINAIGSSITTTADGNLQIILSTGDVIVGVGGVETINATLLPNNPNRAVISEFDGSGSASGELRLQNATAAAATPSSGYAFQVSGFDGGEENLSGTLNILSMGGILNVDGAGTISGTGSIFDANDNSSGTTFQGETLQAGKGTVSAPDSFGRVVFSITPTDNTDFPQISWVGYIVDSTRITLVETSDSYFGTTGGIAYSQGTNTGTFSSSSISGGTYVTGMTGFDGVGALQAVSMLTFGTGVTGFLDFNDLTGSEPVSPDPVSAASYTVDSTGRVTITGLSDGSGTSINLQLYLDGNGDATAVTMDTTDDLAGIGFQQSGTGTLSDANFTGNYALVATGWDVNEEGEISAVGPVTATGTGDTFSGFTDFNFFGTTFTNQTASGTYAVTAASGILTGSITGLDVDSGFSNTDVFNFYLGDASGDSFTIETDSNQLTLGIFEQQ
jgi:hypothetical protein